METLLKNVNNIINDYDESILKNGENFNIYTLLGLERRENDTHSQIIADLLSPKGSHGQGTLFLKSFLRTLSADLEFSDNYIEVIREFFIGLVNEDSTEGGRIDILIKIGNQYFIIENKIDAGEQKNQIERYYNAFPNAKIYFLTLDGKKSNEHENLKNKGINYYCISYENEIKKWLEDSIKVIEGKDYLKNSIKQYINLVNNLTFNGYKNKMEKQVINEISNSLLAGYEIKNNYQNAFAEVESKCYKKILQPFSNNFEIGESQIIKSSWKSKNIAVGFEREGYNLFYGVCTLNNNEPIPVELKDKLNFLLDENNSPTLSWPYWEWYFNGDEKRYIEEFLLNDEKQIELQKKLSELSEKIDSII